MDRFLAATLAFGHTGFLVTEGGMPNAVRSYYSVQQVHGHYAEERVVDIRYAERRAPARFERRRGHRGLPSLAGCHPLRQRPGGAGQRESR